MKTIEYFFSPPSPWSYLGHDCLLEMAARHGMTVRPRPFALATEIFPISGGLPLNKRSPQRQAYRLVELKRWSEFRDVPLNIHPRFFPVPDVDPASLMICAVIGKNGDDAGLRLAAAQFRALWVEERDIADKRTLIEIAQQCGLDGEELWQTREEGRPLYEENTEMARRLQVFGAPWYVYDGEPFWGQDRLDFLERALARQAAGQ